MATTVAQPLIKAKFATVYDQPVTIAKIGGALFVIHGDGGIEDFDIAMAPFTVVLGDVQAVEMQTLYDGLRGGAARIACDRQMEVA
jgi:hypothetical protein